MSLKQTRDRDHDPCDEGGEERELQQQFMHDESHRKSPLREHYRRQGDDTGEQQ
jgi:hypothetical protein